MGTVLSVTNCVAERTVPMACICVLNRKPRPCGSGRFNTALLCGNAEEYRGNDCGSGAHDDDRSPAD